MIRSSARPSRFELPKAATLVWICVALAATGPFTAVESCTAQLPGQNIFSYLNLDYPGMGKVKAAVQRNDLAGAESAYLDFRRTQSTAKYQLMPSDRPAASVAASDPKGDMVVQHRIQNATDLRRPPTDMGSDFNWTLNPLPANDPHRTDEFTYYVIRTPFWNTLGDAYWKTGDEKYAREWVQQLDSFVTKNPRTNDGKNGTTAVWRSLDTAIRMSDSWPYAYYHMRDSPSFTPQAEWYYLDMMQEHAIVIVGALDNTASAGNWVAAECYGLFSIGTLFPELKDAAKWRQMAIDRILVELDRSVGPDGFEAELTPSYHVVTIEGFRGPLQLALLNNTPIPDALKSKRMSMYRALVIAMEQNGDLVNTNDSGDTNAIETAKEGLKLAYDPLLDWAVSGGKSGKGLPYSTLLPYAGFYTMRGGWDPNDLFMLFRAGPTGIGHEHEDMLEVTMKAWGKDLLVDPGNSLYDKSDNRRFFIGTESHNTITIDGKWQHRGTSPAPVTARVQNPLITSPLFDFAFGTYASGYQQNVYDAKKEYQPEDWVGPVDGSVTHTRQVLYLRPYYAFVLDTVDGTGAHVIDSRFDVRAPSVSIDPATQAAFSQDPAGAQIGIYPMDRQNLTAEVVQGTRSSPDIKWNTPTVHFQKRQSAPATFATFLYPFQGPAPGFTSTSLQVTGGASWGQTIHTSLEDADIVMMKSAKPAAFSVSSSLFGGIDAMASGLIARRPTGSQEVLLGSWGITSFNSTNLKFRTDSPANLVISLQGGKPVFLNNGEKAVLLTLQQPFAQTVTLSPGAPVAVDSAGTHAVTNPSMVGMPPRK